ncbi:MAG: IS66 family transposase, partial [Kangiellaceae bacterium]
MNDITLLQQENKKLKSDLEASVNQSTLWQQKYESILEQFRLSQQRRFLPSSEKNILQQDLFDETGDFKDDIQPDNKEATIEVHAHKRVKPKRKPLPDNLAREEIIHDVSESEKKCDCGHQKEQFGEEVTEQLEVVQPKLTVIRHVRPKYSCKNCCESCVSIAQMPNLLLPKSMATPSLITFIILAKYCDHLPLYRQQGIWKRYGIDIPRNTMCGWLLSVADLCEPLWEQLKLHLLTYDYIQADETTVQVMKENDRKNTRKSYIWVYQSGYVKKKVVVYDYQETRAGQHARDFLQGFKGYLQTDGYKGYDWVVNYKEITHLGCMAHARRPFAELVKMLKKPGRAHQGSSYFNKLYKVETEAKNNNLNPEQRFSLRQEKSKPILDNLKSWLEKIVRGSPPQGKLGKGINYVVDRWGELTNYLQDGRLEIDNNGVENSIRPFAIGRKNWLFMGSPRGARAGVIFYSLIMTCKVNDINPSRYFNYMLIHLRECKTTEDYKAL